MSTTATLIGLADYSIEQTLADEPGIGRLLLARRRGVTEPVAIKVIDSSHERLRHAFRERGEFLREIDHPGVARVVDAGTIASTGSPWTATAYAPGLSVADLLEWLGPTLDPALVLQVCIAICQGLVRIEERFGIHGDVRPRNLGLAADGTLRLLDLGFPSLAGEVVLPGARAYAAPELLEERIDVDVRADLYALGVSAYVLLAGRHALTDEAVTRPAQLDPRDVNASIEEPIARIVMGLTAADRDRRYDGPRQAGQDLVRALRGEAPIGPGGKFAAVTLDALVRASKVFTGSTLLRDVHAKVLIAKAARAKRSEPEQPPPPTGRDKLTTTRRFYVSAVATTPVEVDTNWMQRASFQASWCHGEKADWNEIRAKREYFFRHATGQDEAVPALDRQAASEEALHAEDVRAKKRADEHGDALLLSDDGSRAYQFVRELGRGGQGVVRLVRIMGEQRFDGFAEPVEEAVIKTSKEPESLEREHSVYKRANQGIVKLLDAGTVSGKRGYLVLERLYLHPLNLFTSADKRMSVDVATAIDTFVNLLDILHGLHVRKEMPIVLGDIKPDNIMLRMSNRGGTPSLQEYLRRISAGAYEPVFMDMGCALERDKLRENNGRLDVLLGTPIYLPPESTPVITSGTFEPGVYGPKTDVYALTLSFYEYLTADRPYRASGLYRAKGRQLIMECLELKHAHASPIDPDLLFAVLGPETKTFRRILDMGLHPDPERRPSALALLEECKRTFKVKQNLVKTVGEYRYDEGKGLKYSQERFPRIDPQENRYLECRRKLTGTGAVPAPDQQTVDDWSASRGRHDGDTLADK